MKGWQNSFLARQRDAAWKMKHGISVLGKPSGISRTGRVYLPSEPATNPEGLAVAAAAQPSDSKNLPAPGATPDADTLRCGHNGNAHCACGKIKKASHIVCTSCWFSSPHTVRHELQFGNVSARRAAMRLLLEAASGRRALRELAKEKYV